MDNIVDHFINSVEDLYKSSKQGQDGFEIQFNKIKQKSLSFKKKYSSKIGENNDNRKKNRYKDILPFDHTRVILPSTEENSSDYINASFIRGPTNCRSYIASQGPMPNTVNDFWKMLWNYNVEVIIMVCRQVELGKQKCEKYWSSTNNEVMKFGSITVSLEFTEKYELGFIQRRLIVKNENVTRYINQFHFENWPDHGVPRNRDSILAMINTARKFQDYKFDQSKPLCVHCSAGCGRTGVVIVIDYFRNMLYQKLLSMELTVFDVICDLRIQRPSIVQTKDQYEFVHLAISEMFAKHMKAQGKSLSADLSRSLISTNYENVTFSEKSVKTHFAQTPQVPIKNILSRMPIDNSYENVTLSENISMEHSKECQGSNLMQPTAKPRTSKKPEIQFKEHALLDIKKESMEISTEAPSKSTSMKPTAKAKSRQKGISAYHPDVNFASTEATVNEESVSDYTDLIEPSPAAKTSTQEEVSFKEKLATSTTPPIPERTPESEVLLASVVPERTLESQMLLSPEIPEFPSNSPTLVVSTDRSHCNRSAYEEIRYEDASTERKPSSEHARRTSGVGGGVKSMLGKLQNKFTQNTFSQIGVNNPKDENSNQTVACGGKFTYPLEPVMLRNKDISFGHRVERKPKGSRGMPEKWKKPAFLRK